MAYYRRYNRAYNRYAPTRSYRKRTRAPWYSKMGSALSVANKALRATKYLKGLVNSEMHIQQLTIAQTVVAAGSVVSIVGISEGDSQFQRNGLVILLKYVKLKLGGVMHASATDTIIRVILFVDLQQQSDAVPTVTDVLQSSSVNAFYQAGQMGRFRILYDKAIPMSAVGSSANWHIDLHIPVKLHVKYNGTAATDLQKNGIFLLLVADEATNVPTVDGETRVGFHDN